MCKSLLFYFVLTFAVVSCKKSDTNPLPVNSAPPPTTPSADAGLKDIVIPHLPSPYYHFEYDDDRKIKIASFASDFFRYEVNYQDLRIQEMKNSVFGNQNSLNFLYDISGRVITVNYLNNEKSVFRRANLEYNGPLLVELQNEVLTGNDFIINKTLTLSYYADSNLSELKVHYPAANGSEEINLVYNFSEYDRKKNVDGFSLLHTDFFDQLILLPGVRIQKNNPEKETLSGGNNYIVEYTYTYNNNDLPLSKVGDLLFTSGPDSGKHFEISSFYSYY